MRIEPNGLHRIGQTCFRCRQPLPLLAMVARDTLLRLLELGPQPAIRRTRPGCITDLLDSIVSECLQEDLILWTGVGPRSAAIPLSSAPSDQLTVDASRGVGFANNHMQATGIVNKPVKPYVGSPTGHVGRDRDAARLSCMRDDIGLLSMVSCIQNDMLDRRPTKHFAQLLGMFNGASSNQDSSAFTNQGDRLLANAVPLVLTRRANDRL